MREMREGTRVRVPPGLGSLWRPLMQPAANRPCTDRYWTRPFNDGQAPDRSVVEVSRHVC